MNIKRARRLQYKKYICYACYKAIAAALTFVACVKSNLRMLFVKYSIYIVYVSVYTILIR